jgi:hypothetical protein
MRYAIKQINTDRELWLVRAAKKGVWGKSERAFGFFRRLTAERWVAKLCLANPGLCLEIVEVMSRVEMLARESAATSEADSGEPDAEDDVELLPEPQAA